ncbi:MAG: hypothetical protein WCO63_06485 [Bacteroidota bacterium]
MTQVINTGLLEKTLSSVFPNRRVALLAEILLLFLMGALAAALHAKLRIPMQIPGRQGLVFMAVVILSRSFTKLPFASTVSFAGAAATMALFPLGFGAAFTPIIYLWVGICCDLFFRLSRLKSPKILLVGVISGLSWMTIPLFRILLTLSTGIYFDSFRFGYVYPVATHLLFGFLGGLLGFSAYRMLQSNK